MPFLLQQIRKDLLIILDVMKELNYEIIEGNGIEQKQLMKS